MNRNFLFFVSAIVLVALAACGKGDEETAATTTGTETTSTDKGAAVSPPAPVADNGNAEKGPDLVKSLRENAGVTGPEEKAAAIERARGNAVAAAKSVGQTDEQAQAAGEAAAATAQRSFEEREPQ
ncbi:putative small lipoprotein YifL [Ochrobactrum daejeonense]|uniref:Putative small lipoprotein YifL n=1 Tax=Brucella daejeonensis TaxID=659015 RepID=A0A7W9AXX4_9HYPH|nr:putative small lipoprotein YifL [Brucella daejeonensis]